MGSVRTRNSQLFFDFRFKGIRCREQTLLEDTPKNRSKLETFMAQIVREIKSGTFQYEKYFPDSKNLERVHKEPTVKQVVQPLRKMESPLFKNFAEEWFLENEIARRSVIRKQFGGHLINILSPISEKKKSAASPREISLNSVPHSPKSRTEPRSDYLLTESITS